MLQRRLVPPPICHIFSQQATICIVCLCLILSFSTHINLLKGWRGGASQITESITAALDFGCVYNNVGSIQEQREYSENTLDFYRAIVLKEKRNRWVAFMNFGSAETYLWVDPGCA